MSEEGQAVEATRQSLDANRAVAWWRESWALFMKNPGMWLVYGVIYFVISALLGLVPLIGGLVIAVVTQILVGGWMMAARKLDTGGTIEVQDLFLGFKEKLNPLMVLGGLALAATVVIMLVAGLIGGGAMMGLSVSGASRTTGGLLASAGLGLVALMVMIVLGFVFAMAFWYAPALVVFRNMAPIDAVKAGWKATTGNIVALVVYGLIWIVAAVVASIPLMLGWILLGPLTMLGMYLSYIDIFERTATA